MENNNEDLEIKNIRERQENRERLQKEIKDEGRKNFSMGLFSGILISVFLVSVTLCAKVIIDSYRAKTANEEIKENIESVTKDKDSILSDDEALDKIMLIEDIIDQYYIEDMDDAVIEDGIYSGMMQSLGDPYAVYYDEDALKKLYCERMPIYRSMAEETIYRSK